MIDRGGQELIFVLSTPRAGSTLLGAILGSHSQVLCPPEPWFLLSLLGLCDKRLVVAAPYDHDLARRAMLELLDEPLFFDAARAFATTVYGTLLQRHGKRIFVDKNGRYYHIAKSLRRLFPSSGHVWLKRNPLDVIASYKSTWNVAPAALFGELISFNSFDVTASFTTLIEHFASDPPIFEIKYENLVTHPSESVGQMCAALGLAFEDSMLRFFENDPLMRAYTSSTFGDKKIHREHSIHARSIGAWRTTLTPDEVRTALLALGRLPFTAQGYDEDLDAALAYAGLAAADLSLRGRLDEYERALTEYPASISGAVISRPELWSTVGGSSASLVLERAFQQVLDEKEAAIQALAREAEARLELLQAADAERRRLQQALDERQRLLEEKEAAIQALAREAEARLELLQAADAERRRLQQALDERQRLLEEKEAAI